jgi:hypothetical protein
MMKSALHILIFIAALVGVGVLFWARYGDLIDNH